MKILNVAKAALYGIFLNYYCYYVINGSFIPYGTVVFFAVACLAVAFDAVHERYIYVGNEVKCWILYAILALITTSFMVNDTGYISDIMKYLQRIVLVMLVAYICEREKSVRFGLQLMAGIAIACAVSTLTVIDDFQAKLSISSGANLSANDVGSIMAFGPFAIMFCLGKRNQSSLLLSALKVMSIICCMVVIFLAGSRKSFIAVAILLVMMVFLWLTDYRKYFTPKRFLVLLVIGIAAYLFISANLLPYAEQTNLYTRLLGRGAETAGESDQLRLDLYVWALEDFIKHPFFGLGFNEFVTHHGNYTHSTYAEPLACSGVIGFLYLYPYISIVRTQFYLIRHNPKGSLGRLKQKELFVYLCVFLFIGIGIPYMYKDIPCILFGTFLASQAISLEELRSTGRCSASY